MEALVDFTYRRKDAPYRAKNGYLGPVVTVTPAQSRTGLVSSPTGGLAHLDAGIAAVIRNGKATFGARYMCGAGTEKAIILADASAYGDLICEYCVDIKLGPGVYRCFNAERVLLYIGSSKAPLKRQQGHKARTPWWHEVTDVQVQRYPTLFGARGAERLAILAEKPLYNKQPKRQVAGVA